jgi:SpoIIAA-like
MPQASRSLYFENSIGRLWEEPEGYLRLEYKPSPRETVQFRALLTHAAQALSRHKWSNILVDQRQMSPFTSTEQAWMTGEWLPKAVHEHGYRHGAVLVAHNVFARLVMTQLVLGARDLPHTYRTFEDEGDALAWLLQARDG